MKEFRADTGGRYTYNEDVLNLQDLALAFNEIFTECDNFIVSGCEINGQTIGAGYVYINKKLRYFPGASNISQWPQYIYEANHSENTTYASGGSKIARTVYGCQISNQQPSTADPITGQLPGVLTITASGGKTIKDAFFGKYALLLNPTAISQNVNGIVNFEGSVNINGTVDLRNGLKVSSGIANAKMFFSGNTLIVESRVGSRGYQFQISDSGGFEYYSNGILCLTINNTDGIVCNSSISGNRATFGGLTLTESQLYQSSTAGEATLFINSLGYDGDINQFRNTVIGDGKGNAVLTVNGSSKSITTEGSIYVTSNVGVGLLLKAKQAKTSVEMQSYVSWQDKDSFTTAEIGFTSGVDNIFRIGSQISPIQIQATDYVDIGPAIRENGVLLREKYVRSDFFTVVIETKASKSETYSKNESDDRFAKKNGGLTQFLGNNSTQELRNQIDAVGTEQLFRYAKLTNYLADMATDENAKSQIRFNIGACSEGDYQPKLKDTGWQKIANTKALYARQIGNIVSIQGIVRLVHTGIMFTIPNIIDSPRYAVFHTLALTNNKSWSCEIAAMQHNCTVKYCDGACDQETYFSLTYMV